MSRTIVATVVSNKMQKSVVVSIDRYKTHPIYKKRYKVSNRMKAHDEKNICQIGDVVEITETRPISKEKSFVVTKVVKSAGVKK